MFWFFDVENLFNFFFKKKRKKRKYWPSNSFSMRSYDPRKLRDETIEEELDALERSKRIEIRIQKSIFKGRGVVGYPVERLHMRWLDPSSQIERGSWRRSGWSFRVEDRPSSQVGWGLDGWTPDFLMRVTDIGLHDLRARDPSRLTRSSSQIEILSSRLGIPKTR